MVFLTDLKFLVIIGDSNKFSGQVFEQLDKHLSIANTELHNVCVGNVA